MVDEPHSKETLLAEVDRLRRQARRARRLAGNLLDGRDKTTMLNAAKDFDEKADRVEKTAASTTSSEPKR